MPRSINPALLQKTTALLQAQFGPDTEIESAEYLSEPQRRNVLLRIKLKSTSGLAPESVILKQSLATGSDADDKNAYARFARDWAGLEFATSIELHNTPKFYGGDKEQRFILVEDLGEKHVSLVDSLTSADRAKAVAALERFMQALGSFHAAGFERTDAYQEILRKINEDANSPSQDFDALMQDLLPGFLASNEQLGLAVSEELINELTQTLASLYQPGPFTVLAHGDIAPDNVFDHEGEKGLQLMDFEWSFPRSALIDGTYLRMCIPTGWCAKAIPTEVREQAEAIYRAELIKTIPSAADDMAYKTAYTNACVFSLFQEIAHLAGPHLNNILKEEQTWGSGPVPENSLWNPETNLGRPRFLSRLQAFIDVTTENNLLPHLREMATQMLIEVKKLWPNAKPLEYYPAFEKRPAHTSTANIVNRLGGTSFSATASASAPTPPPCRN